MQGYAKRLVFKQEQAKKLLSEYDNQEVLPSVLQNISKIVRLNYASIKILAKKQNITVKRSW
jgi:phosphopantothenate synthetase